MVGRVKKNKPEQLWMQLSASAAAQHHFCSSFKSTCAVRPAQQLRGFTDFTNVCNNNKKRKKMHVSEAAFDTFLIASYTKPVKECIYVTVPECLDARLYFYIMAVGYYLCKFMCFS